METLSFESTKFRFRIRISTPMKLICQMHVNLTGQTKKIIRFARLRREQPVLA